MQNGGSVWLEPGQIVTYQVIDHGLGGKTLNEVFDEGVMRGGRVVNRPIVFWNEPKPISESM